MSGKVGVMALSYDGKVGRRVKKVENRWLKQSLSSKHHHSNQLKFTLLVSRDKLYEVSSEKWMLMRENVQQEMAQMSSAAAWGLGTQRLVCSGYRMVRW